MANLWNPLYLPYGSLANWYDSTDTTTLTLSTNDTVANWRDKSYDANNLSETDFADLPVYGTTNINGLPTVNFDTGGAINLDNNINTSLNSNSLYIMFVGFSNVFASASTTFNLTNVDNDSMLLRIKSGVEAQLLVKKGGVTNTNMIINGNTSNTNVIYTLDFTSSTSVSAALNYDPLSVGARDELNAPGEFTQLTLGAQSSEVNGFNGQIGEFVVVQQASLSLEDKQKLEGYTAWKWGQQTNLPVGHPYKLAAPTVTDVEFRNKLYETSTEEGSSRFRRLFALGYVG